MEAMICPDQINLKYIQSSVLITLLCFFQNEMFQHQIQVLYIDNDDDDIDNGIDIGIDIDIDNDTDADNDNDIDNDNDNDNILYLIIMMVYYHQLFVNNVYPSYTSILHNCF